MQTSRAGIPLLVCLAVALNAAPLAADPIIIEENDDVAIVKNPEFGDDLFPVALGEGDLTEAEFGSGSLGFHDYNEDPLSDSGNPSWWAGVGSVFTTETNTMVVTFDDLFVTAFTVRIGANTNAQAWIRAYYTDSGGQGQELYSGTFTGIKHGVSPMYGVLLKDTGNCAKLTSVVIDPDFVWGIGDMSVATNDACAVSVPEPGSLGLLGAGLLALGFVWHTRRQVPVSV